MNSLSNSVCRRDGVFLMVTEWSRLFGSVFPISAAGGLVRFIDCMRLLGFAFATGIEFGYDTDPTFFYSLIYHGS